MYQELLILLSGGDLSEDEAAEKSATVEAGNSDPEYEWLVGYDPEEIVQIVIEFELIDYFLVGDKIDELHELISAEFADPLPPFPYDKVDLTTDYFRWLDAEFASYPTPWEALLWHNFIDDNLHVVVVRRSDTERILYLAETMGLRVKRSTAQNDS